MPTKKTAKVVCKKATAKPAAKPAAKATRSNTGRQTVAILGFGIQARTGLVPQFLKAGTAVLTICDCDRTRRAAGVKMVNDFYAANGAPELVGLCKEEADFRNVLKDPDVQMVCVSAPDHWHAYMSIEAMKAGKDVYCEKPLTYSVEEAVLVMKAQKKYKRIFQCGAMQRSWREFRTACMIVRNGFIGEIQNVDCNYGQGTNAPLLGGPSQPHRFYSDLANAEKEGAPNPDVDWDMWLGPAPWSPYSDQCAPRGVHTFWPMFWRFDDAFATGYNGDWGAHHLDIAQWGLDLDKSGPVKVICSTEPHSTNPIHGCRRQQGMKFVLENGCVIHHNPFSTWGTVFYGTKGVVAVNRGKIGVWKGRGVKPTEKVRKEIADGTFKGMKCVAASIGRDYGTDTAQKKDNALDAALETLEKFFDLENAPLQLYKVPGGRHVENFVLCCKSRKPTIAPAETGARAAILTQLCNISYVYDSGFDWDPKKCTFANGTGDPLWLKRPVYRNGWNITL